jgi:hypothetical protein
MIKTISKKQIMSSKIENRLSGFSLNPDLADCSNYLEEHPPCEAVGQSEPGLSELIKKELRGIPLKTQVNAINALLLALEQEEYLFQKKIYDRNNFKHWPINIVCKNCFSLN